MSAIRWAVLAAAFAAAAPAAARAQRVRDGVTVATGMSRADAAYAAGDRARAEREYAAIVAADSSQSHALFRLAQLRSDRDPAGAAALYRRYVALEPADAWGHLALGDALAARGDLAAGLAEYARAEQLAPAERDVHVGRARLLARAGHTDAAITDYEAWVARTPGDADAWRELAAQRRRAGRYPEAIAALERVDALDRSAASRRRVARDVPRLRRLGGAAIEPSVSGSRDSDGLTTARAGLSMTSPLVARLRVSVAGTAGSAGDGVTSRAAHEGEVALQYRPLAQLRLELAGGAARADRTLVDTVAAATTPTGSGGPGRGQGAPIGRPVVAGSSSFDVYPVGRARLVWRKPGDAIAIDARASRQLLDASPFLVAQGVMRDEAGLSVDLRLVGPMRLRGFGRVGAVHNADESNGRQVFGGALAYAPGPYEVTLRAQTMRYDTATTLAYFAPRQVRTMEATTYLERETDGGVTIALDLGAGAQQVAEWSDAASSWSPAFHGWAQVVVPLTAALALGTELEAYDSRIGTETPSLTLPASRWRYGSARLWLRVGL